MIEIWKDIPDYEGLYQVSNLGRVKSLKFNKIRILKVGINGNGYYNVVLYKDSAARTFTVHQLVAIAFLQHKTCGLKLVIDHINDDKLDNRLENLQIVTNRYNVFKTQGNHTSNYKGVSWAKTRNKWRSVIYINSKVKHLGYYQCQIEANKAYLKELNKITL